jgi:hypothetical protein
MRTATILLITVTLAGLLAACGAAEPETELPEPVVTVHPTSTYTETPTPSSTATATPTPSNTPTITFTPSITPTWAVLRGQVSVDGRASCRFGPGASYLYKFSYADRTYIDLLGRTDTGSWVLTQAAGGTNRCWLSADYIEVEASILAVEPVDVHSVLAWSPYYGGLTGVVSYREQDTVTVSWDALVLRAGDDSEQVPYILEAWVCTDGVVSFTSVGTYSTSAQVVDEAGCSESSWGRLLGAEKHGYTPWVQVFWPQHPDNDQ